MRVRPTRDRRSERGAVMVMVAAWLPVLALFVSFAVDAAHWWDYSRNLQNRADAAAFAGGDQLAVCLGSPTPADETQIGEIAQQYSGPPTNTPLDLIHVPYPSSPLAPNYNIPNLTSGAGPEGPDFHVLLNSSGYWPTVPQNGPSGYGDMGPYCNAVDPAADPSDPNACVTGNTCAIVDSRITQGNVPLFFRLLNLHPNITAHARVQLQIVGGLNNALPVGVGDAGASSCMAARLVDETTKNAGANKDGVLAEWSLSRPDPNNNPTTWSGAMPSALSIPTSNGTPDQLSVQAMIPANCSDPFGSDGGLIYDVTKQNVNQGIVYINTYKPLSPPVSAPTRGSVWLEALSCADPYFNSLKSGSCTVRLHAQVDFPSGSSGVATVSEDGGSYSSMTAEGTDAAGNQYWYADFTIPAESGRHTFSLGWSGAGTGKFNGGNPLQATFAAFDDGTGQDDSGPVIQAQVGCVSSSGCPGIGNPPMSTDGDVSGVDSIPGSGTGSSPQLQVMFKLQGLAQSGPTDKASVLRSSVSDSTSHRTGIFDCGQGGSASAFFNVATGGGCGTFTGTSGLTLYQGPLDTPITAGVQWPDCAVLPADPISCGQPVSGNMRQQVNWAIATDICGDKNCVSTPSGKACDYWQPYKADTGPLPNDANYPDDPRAIPMVITAPQDLAMQGTQPPWIRVLGFAIFYVTGWDGDPYIQGSGNTIPGCNPVPNDGTGTPTNVDEPYPYGTAPNNAVWGHFIGYVIPSAGGSGKKCVVGSALACTPALTR